MKKLTVRNILVPVDFSELSLQAIETAKTLARRFGSAIHLAHVHEFYYPAGFISPGAPVPMSMMTFRDDSIKRYNADLKALARRSGLSEANCHVQSGTPTFNEICMLAREIPADLIVTPTHGYTGLNHFFEGSTAERLVQHSPCPVFVVRADEKSGSPKVMPIDKILVPVDFSGCSLDALKYAIQFAEEYAARILVFHAVYLGYAYASDGYPMYDFSVFEKALRKDAERKMREFVRRAKFGRVKFETAIRVGPPVSEICAMAEGPGVDLIITSTHGLSGFKHVLIGSTAEQVVRRAPRPVLIVPSHPEVRATHLSRTSGAQTKAIPQRRTRTVARRKQSARNRFTKSDLRSRVTHAFPERRKTNKYRETHMAV